MPAQPSVLVVTSRDLARTFRAGLDRLRARDAVVLAPAGLSCAGWVHDPHDPIRDTVVTKRGVFPADDVDQIITALDYVQPFDLPHVHPDDRLFVAQEMTAFLRSWLAARSTLVLDRPTPTALSGPAGDPDRWYAAIRAVGIADRRAAPTSPFHVTRVTVVEGQVVGRVAARLAAIARALVAAAGVATADLRFAQADDGVVLAAAGPWWLRPAPEVLAAVLDRGSRVRPPAVANPS